jgi:DNA-directed RNA polymerase specialized sigma24 family protein
VGSGHPSTEPMPHELLWFDRDRDPSGNRIRADVREAAKKKWPQVRALAQRRLGNRDLEIQELFEAVVAKVSGYLNEIHAPQQDPSGLLVLKFKQELNSLARRLERLQPSGNAKDMEPLLNSADWGEDADRRIFLEEVVRSLTKVNRAVLRLRGTGYSWDEIALMFRTNASTLRNNFWREIRALHSKLTGGLFEGNADADEERGKVS